VHAWLVKERTRTRGGRQVSRFSNASLVVDDGSVARQPCVSASFAFLIVIPSFVLLDNPDQVVVAT
jgi:hypothetical protein